jgi:1,4-dihydroxy-2-naphthoate octaprenyltransferase
MPEEEVRPGSLRAWLAFTRPKTFGVAVAPVIAALSLAYAETGIFKPLVALFTFTMAICMQALTNMKNDLGYTERHAETGNRRGLPRATARGWLTVGQARNAIRLTIALGLLNTAVLIYFGGWFFAVIGIASTVAAYAYMGGPKPIAYTPFGEITVLIFFGLTAVLGTYWLQAHMLTANSVALGAALGAIASAVLCVNNWRDREHDESISRRTLAVVAGEKRFPIIFAAVLYLPFALVALMMIANPQLWPCVLTFIAMPRCAEIFRQMRTLKHEALNGTMLECVKLELKFSLLFSIGALLSVLLAGY